MNYGKLTSSIARSVRKMSWADRVRSCQAKPIVQRLSFYYRTCCDECNVLGVLGQHLPDDTVQYIIDFVRPPPPPNEKICQVCEKNPAYIKLRARSWDKHYPPLPVKYRGDVCTACFPHLNDRDFAQYVGGLGTQLGGYACTYDRPYPGRPIAFHNKEIFRISVDKTVRLDSWCERLTYKIIASGVTWKENWHHDRNQCTVKVLDNKGIVWMKVGKCQDSLVGSAIQELRKSRGIHITRLRK